MVGHRDYGKGAGPNHIHLCHLETYATPIHHIEFQYDNEGFVAAISKGSSKDIVVMHLLRSLWFSSHTWTSPLQLHTYQVWWTQFLLWKVSLPVQPSHVSVANSLTTLDLPYCLPSRSRLGFPSSLHQTQVHV